MVKLDMDAYFPSPFIQSITATCALFEVDNTAHPKYFPSVS